jgi:hypothetical protein
MRGERDSTGERNPGFSVLVRRGDRVKENNSGYGGECERGRKCNRRAKCEREKFSSKVVRAVRERLCDAMRVRS